MNLNRDNENSVVQRDELLYGELLNVGRGGEQLPVDKALMLRAEGEELLQELFLGGYWETVEDLRRMSGGERGFQLCLSVEDKLW